MKLTISQPEAKKKCSICGLDSRTNECDRCWKLEQTLKKVSPKVLIHFRDRINQLLQEKQSKN